MFIPSLNLLLLPLLLSTASAQYIFEAAWSSDIGCASAPTRMLVYPTTGKTHTRSLAHTLTRPTRSLAVSVAVLTERAAVLTGRAAVPDPRQGVDDGHCARGAQVWVAHVNLEGNTEGRNGERGG